MHITITVFLTIIVREGFVWQGALTIPTKKQGYSYSVGRKTENDILGYPVFKLVFLFEPDTYDEGLVSIDLSRSTKLIGDSSLDVIFPPAIIKWTFLVLLRMLVGTGSECSLG